MNSLSKSAQLHRKTGMIQKYSKSHEIIKNHSTNTKKSVYSLSKSTCQRAQLVSSSAQYLLAIFMIVWFVLLEDLFGFHDGIIKDVVWALRWPSDFGSQILHGVLLVSRVSSSLHSRLGLRQLKTRSSFEYDFFYKLI